MKKKIKASEVRQGETILDPSANNKRRTITQIVTAGKDSAVGEGQVKLFGMLDELEMGMPSFGGPVLQEDELVTIWWVG